MDKTETAKAITAARLEAQAEAKAWAWAKVREARAAEAKTWAELRAEAEYHTACANCERKVVCDEYGQYGCICGQRETKVGTD